MVVIVSLVLLPFLQASDQDAKRALKWVNELRSDSIETRQKAERELIALGPNALPALKAAIRDPNPEVAARAKRLLVVIPPLEGVSPALVAAFPGIKDRLATVDDPVWTTEFLRITKGLSGGKVNAPSLRAMDLDGLIVRAIRGAEGYQLEKVCLTAVHLRLPSAVPEFSRLMLGHKDLTVRQGALHALVAMDAKETVPAIEKLFGLKDEYLKAYAAWGIAELSPDTAAGKISGLLDRKDAFFRMSIAGCLYGLGVPESKRLLIEGLSHESQYTRVSAAQAVGGHRIAEAVPALLLLLDDPERDVRIKAAWALARIGQKGTIPDVARQLKDKGDYVRAQAALRLGELGALDQTAAIVRLLKDPVYPARMCAAEALALLGARESAPAVRELLKDEKPFVQWHVIPLLATLGDSGAVPELLPLLKKNRLERTYAARALGDLGATEAAPLLVPLLRDGWHPARVAATEALLKLNYKEAAPSILELLDDKEEAVRRAAARALGLLGEELPLGPYSKLLTHEDIRTRLEGLEMLVLLGRDRAVPTLRAELKNPDLRMRIAAAQWLSDLGKTDGVEVLLKESWDLTFLNALRNPQMWRRLHPLSYRFARSIPTRGWIEKRAGEKGVHVDWETRADGEPRQWEVTSLGAHHEEVARAKLSLALEGVPGYARYAIILEDGRIRAVSRAEALVFWREWWTKRGK